MALLFMESFDSYGTAPDTWAVKWHGSSKQTSTSPVRTGTYAMWNNWYRNISPGSTTLIFGGALYWVTGQTGQVLVGSNPGGTTFTENMCTFQITAGGAIEVYRGYSTLIITSAAVLVSGAWNFIEIKVNVADAGSYVVKVNGAEILNDSSEDMTAGGTIAYLGVSCQSGSRWDDVYLLDSTGSLLNDFIGDCKVECLSPQTGNGTNTGLTTSTGSDHGALVDELPPNDDTDYNSGTTIGVKDTYNFPSLATTGVVKAVQVRLRAKKTDSPTKQVVAVARSGGTDYDGGTTHTMATGYGDFSQIWETDPADSAAWTVADVNAAEFGMKITT